jgi:gliding motility-associated lipoprotein GldH
VQDFNKKQGLILLNFFVFCCISLVLSCNQGTYYNAEIDIPSGKWNMDSAATFITEIPDTSQQFDIQLAISNSNEYRYSNVWFFIKSKSPEGFTHIDTIDIPLAENNGKWFGDKSGKYYRQEIFYKKQIRFPKPGIYRFEIVQGMREPDLRGIYKIEFTIFKTE